MCEMLCLASLELAVSVAGSQSALARLIGKKQAHIWYWLRVSKKIPAEHVIAIEKATGVSRSALRPDIYPVSGQ